MLIEADARLGRHSYYEASVQRGPPLPPLQGAVDADVMVVGAGFAGLSAARPGATAGRPSSVMPAARRLSSSNWARRRRARPGPCRSKPSA